MIEHDAFQPTTGVMGSFGGSFTSELLLPALAELETAWKSLLQDDEFQSSFHQELRSWAGRPTPLTFAARLSEDIGCRVYLKREDLLHGGAHKTNNVIGQGLLAKALGKKRIVAETGAGQHGAAVAMVAAHLDLDAVIYMGEVDIERQQPNVKLMELCGATVIPVTSGKRTLTDAVNEALRDWTSSVESTHYLLGTVCGPHPFPSMVADFQRVIGDEAREQFLAMTDGALPDLAVACVGGGSNAIGLWTAFLSDPVQLIGVEPRGRADGPSSATLCDGSPGLLHGARTIVLQDSEGQILEAECLAAGLDYPGVGPKHAELQETGRATYVSVNDDEALDAFEALSELEGIVPAFESSHAIAYLKKSATAGHLKNIKSVIVCLSGSGRKDLDTYFALNRENNS